MWEGSRPSQTSVQGADDSLKYGIPTLSYGLDAVLGTTVCLPAAPMKSSATSNRDRSLTLEMS